MQYEVMEEKDNKFFNRKDLMLRLKHANAPTPSKAELVKELCTNYKVDPEQVVVDYIFTKKNVCESIAKVKILKEKPKKVERAKEVKKAEEAGEVEKEQPSKGESDEAQISETK